MGSQLSRVPRPCQPTGLLSFHVCRHSSHKIDSQASQPAFSWRLGEGLSQASFVVVAVDCNTKTTSFSAPAKLQGTYAKPPHRLLTNSWQSNKTIRGIPRNSPGFWQPLNFYNPNPGLLLLLKKIHLMHRLPRRRTPIPWIFRLMNVDSMSCVSWMIRCWLLFTSRRDKQASTRLVGFQQPAAVIGCNLTTNKWDKDL